MNQTDQIVLALKESNAIEDVWDEDSLKKAIKAWEYIIAKKKLTAIHILKAHAILMKGKLPSEELGKWRTRPVWIGGKEGKPWYVIPEVMTQWLEQANQANDSWVSLKRAEEAFKDDHIFFEAIHPFIDGNGRMGRILMNWQRVKAGMEPMVILEKEKQDYYKWFKI